VIPTGKEDVGMYISVDVGGSQVCIRAWKSLTSDEPSAEHVFAVTRPPVVSFNDLEEDLNRIADAIREMEANQGLDILGIGIGVAGKVSRDRTRLVMSGILPHWVGYDIVDWMEARFSCTIVLGNDVEVLAIAEEKFGSASYSFYARTSFLLVNWDYGVSAVLVDRKELSNGHGSKTTYRPSEFGHLMIDRNSQLTCVGCDTPGHLEALCGGDRLRQRFQVESYEDLTREQWDVVVEDLVFGFQQLLTVLPAPLVVISGDLIYGRHWILQRLQSEFDDLRFENPKFELTELHETAVASAHLLLTR